VLVVVHGLSPRHVSGQNVATNSTSVHNTTASEQLPRRRPKSVAASTKAASSLATPQPVVEVVTDVVDVAEVLVEDVLLSVDVDSVDVVRVDEVRVDDVTVGVVAVALLIVDVVVIVEVLVTVAVVVEVVEVVAVVVHALPKHVAGQCTETKSIN
jgi:hypothetical protein